MTLDDGRITNNTGDFTNMDMEATGMWLLAKTNGDFCSTSPGGPNFQTQLWTEASET